MEKGMVFWKCGKLDRVDEHPPIFFKTQSISKKIWKPKKKKSTWDTVSVRSFNGEHIYVSASSNASSAATAILVTTTHPGTEQMFIEITRGKNISGLSLN